ncbi:MAG: flavodoxin-dependent (E)-4-hydroxy-3-methylbut-2-enyl-diphosphate synthase [Elusimicrobia bacterium]|nr:flavodoxin-dependent (E)-4-hydroxy-3-methylbut-2-enyl-diphosphate synthase [Elusimicrobiota bacterium]
MIQIRRKTRPVKIGKVTIGGGAPIAVQTMCTTDTRDVAATVAQIRAVEKAGCEIIRVAVPDMEAAKQLRAIKEQIAIPLVADIHFSYQLALEAIKQGVDKVRINPGNIGSRSKTEAVVKAAKDAGIPMRVGVNAVSLKILKQSDRWTEMTTQEWARQMVNEAMEQIDILNSFDFHDIVISLKADDIGRVVAAYQLMAQQVDYPLHVGLTEAGTLLSGTVKSTIALATLLSEGIGDTIRVSLTEDPVIQVRAGFEILKALRLRTYGPEIIACPTCGRCEVELFQMVNELEKRLGELPLPPNQQKPLKIAVMGCVVNGPGEAKDADFGIAGGKGVGVFIRKGEVVRNVPEGEWVNTLIEEIKAHQQSSPPSN